MADLGPFLPIYYGPALADVRQIVIHSVESGMTPGIGESLMTGWWRNPANKSSVHGIADPRDYCSSVSEGQRAWHCGAGNPTSVGIEHSGRAAFTKDEWLTVAAVKMLNNSARNTSRIAERHGIPLRWLSVAEVRANARGFCFTADTRILTRRGLIPANEVRIGDDVWTHKSRWRPVVSTMSREADLVALKGQGHDRLLVTPEHPFLARKARIRNVADPNSASGRNTARVFGEADWVDAANMTGMSWLTPMLSGDFAPPTLSSGAELSPEDMWIIGRWVADGHLADSGRVIFSIGNGKNADFREHAGASQFRVADYESRHGSGCAQLRVHSPSLSEWLHDNFGELAHGKRIPTWLLFSHEKYRSEFLAGYLSGDGYQHPKYAYNEASTVSPALAIGLRLLGTGLGLGASLYHQPARRGSFINGREIVSGPSIRVRFQEIGTRAGFAERDGHILGSVKSVEPAGRGVVYNISVAEDESYVADGFVVHNCTHNDMRLARGGTTHTDPGPNFPYALYMQLVQQWAGVPVGGTGTNTDNTSTPAGPGGAEQEDTNDMADITDAQMDRIADKVVNKLLSPDARFAVGDQVATLVGALADLLRARLSPAEVWEHAIPPGYKAQDVLASVLPKDDLPEK